MIKVAATILALVIGCSAAIGQSKLTPAAKAEIDQLTQSIASAPTAYNYRERARVYLINDMYQDCETDATRAIELEPGSARAWSMRGGARVGMRRYGEGLQDLNKALSLATYGDKTYIATLSERSYCYWHMGMKKEAHADRQKLVEIGAEPKSVLKDDTSFE